MSAQPPLPEELAACHDLIRSLTDRLSVAEARLREYEQRERREFERMYGRGATPQSLLNFGRLITGQGGVTRSPNPDDPTVGEVYLRARAQERAAKRKRSK